ncbi:YhfH family protein [Halobacillus salinarum]|uniref:YhfH family protein n=1 Tax=Halobacillus salinarum TaxID=2932257 RepID=A0ABY4EP70_9BACI|nr:YhfH family protein [Halobacillus salinarum]UOQ45994.1 YhfH family protein [Halobacillus salinarum]
MKTKEKEQKVAVPCPQCGSEMEVMKYSYIMECDHCLSKRQE